MVNVTVLIASVGGAVVVTALLVWLLARRKRAEVSADLTPLVAQVEQAMVRLEGQVQGHVSSLGQQIGQIAAVFTNDRVRGSWGELTLKNLLEYSGLSEGRDFVMQDTGGNGRPDATVLLPGNRKLIIDAKFPIARLLDALDVDDPTEGARLLVEHAKEIERDARALIERGYQQDAAGGFVVMYLPHEAVFQAAMVADPGLFDRLMARRIVLAGPSTLLAVLCASAQLLVEQRAVAEAREIVDDAKELHKRLGVFVGHFAKIGRNLDSASHAYNEAVGSWTSRVSVQADRLADRAGVTAVAEPAAVDTQVRDVPTLQKVG
jgi:DNA recombination protein RmuC